MDRLLTTQEVADWLNVPIRTVYKWNHMGTGPARIRVGTQCRYRASDVQRWLDRHLIQEGEYV